MIEVSGLSKHFGELKAVDNISFQVHRGEIVGFLGPNGAGKTTTMRILTGFFPPTHGKASVAGFDVFENSKQLKETIGYLPENPPLYDEMTVRKYLKFVAKIKGIRGHLVSSRIDTMVEKLSLEQVIDRLIGNISKGYRQRVALAQALIHEPEVLILDEPTIGLDPQQIIEIRDLIKGLAGSRTIILSSHILQEVSATCGRVIIINKGRLVAVDTHEGLAEKARGKHGKTLSLLAKGPASGISATVEKMEGVIAVHIRSEDNNLSHLEIECPADHSFREALFSIMAENRWPILELKGIESSLEDVFLKLTTEENQQ